MSAIEQRARELLAQAFGCDERELSREEVRAARAVLAWQEALTPPEGFVLVEEKIFDSMREFVTGFHGMSRNNAENLAAEIVEELDAARPEVKP